MTRPRIVFLDIDGTYATRGVVPAGHVAAVQAARRAGNLVLLCTGRPRSMVPQRILASGFDGLVAGGGAYVQVGDEVLADRRFPPELAARTVAVLDRHAVPYLLEAPEAIYAAPGIDDHLKQVLAGHLADPSSGSAHPLDLLDRLRIAPDRAAVSFGKVTFFDSSVPGSQLGAEIGDDIGVLPSSIPDLVDTGGELFQPGVHKALGIQTVLDHFAPSGPVREDVVAVGDGANDIEMLRFAGLGIAIEGSPDAVLAAADRTAPGPEREGLVTVFAELGLV